MTLPRMKAWHFEEEYGSLDYTDAVVLDIGADYGCTAEFFLAHGARRVVACEKNPDWRAKLVEWARDKPVTVIGALDYSQYAAERMILSVAPDIVKVDCEGCEALLLALPDDVMGYPRAWVMETHTLDLYHVFVERFERLGYTVTLVKDFGNEPNRQGKVCKVLTAVREGT